MGVDSAIKRPAEWKTKFHTATAVIPWLALAVFLTALETHFVSVKISREGFLDSLQASQGVLEGLPHWRIYQSRILGPYLVKVIGHLFELSPTAAYFSFIISCLFITKLIVIRFGLMCTDGVASTLLMLVSGSLLFAMLLSNRWLYPWDMGGLVFSTLFVAMVLRGIHWQWFLPLAAFAFLNRESGIFICVWLIAQGWLGYGGSGGRKANVGMMTAGVITALLGLIMTEYLRAHLLVREIGPELWHISPAGTSWFHWQVEANLTGLLSSLNSSSLNIPAIFYALPLAGIVAATVIGIRSYPAYTALCLVYGANLIFVFLFGLVKESRVMIDVIPFFSVFLIYVVTGGKATSR